MRIGALTPKKSFCVKRVSPQTVLGTSLFLFLFSCFAIQSTAASHGSEARFPPKPPRGSIPLNPSNRGYHPSCGKKCFASFSCHPVGRKSWSEATVPSGGSAASEPELNFADSLFAQGDYDCAIGAYQKFIFYNFTSANLPYARYKLSLSYIKSGRKEKGERLLKEIASRSDEIGERARSSLTRFYIEERRLNCAKWLLSLFSADIRLPKKEWLASLLSAFLPGLGEVYSGKPGFGLLSFLVNASCAYGVYHSARRGKKMDAILLFSFLFLRFYQGSIQNAYDFAREYNENYLANRLKNYCLED